MVYVEVKDPLLCRLLDLCTKLPKPSCPAPPSSSPSSSPAPAGADAGAAETTANTEATELISSVVRPFIAAALCNTVDALPPSQLQDALWLYLFLRREYWERYDAVFANGAVDGKTAKDGEKMKVKDMEEASSVRDDGGGGGVCEKATQCARLLDTLTASHRLAFSTFVVGELHTRSDFSSVYAHSKLDELLRQKQDSLAASKKLPYAVSGTTDDKHDEKCATEKKAPAPTPNSPLGSIELALAAFQRARTLNALMTPSTLTLLIRDLESLWCFLHLCTSVKLRLISQSNILVGRKDGLAAGKRSKATNTAATTSEEPQLPRDMFFHDYALLLPAHVLASFASELDVSPRFLLSCCSPAAADRVWQQQSSLFYDWECEKRAKGIGGRQTVNELEKERLPSVSNASRPASPSAAEALRRTRIPVLSPSFANPNVAMDSAPSEANSEGRKKQQQPPLPRPTPSIALIINPAISSSVPNPQRQHKNRRVDVIEQAAMRYYYQRLTQLGRGNGVGRKTGGARSMNSVDDAAAGDDMFTHLQAQLSKVEVTVIDPAQMERHRLPDEDDLDAEGEMFSLHSKPGAAAAGGASSHLLPAHRRMKSLQRLANEKTSFSHFLKDSLIGFDIQMMALSGAAIGYYLGFLRGASKETRLVYAIVGLVSMMLVDAVLLLIRLSREDEATRKDKKRIAKQRAKLSGDPVDDERPDLSSKTREVGSLLLAPSTLEVQRQRSHVNEDATDAKKNQ